MTAPELTGEHPFLLADLPPSQAQRRLAFVVLVALLFAFSVTLPFVNTRLPRVDAFIPAFETAIIINDFITSALLFAQFSVVRRQALLVLANGFLFTALIVIPHALTFPGVFAPSGLLGAGVQTTAMLYYFWHIGAPLAVIGYVLLKDADNWPSISQRSPAVVIASSVAIVIAIVFGLTWIATSADWLMPRIFLDGIQMNLVSHLVGGLMLALWTALALALLWLRRRTVLDLWLMVMCFAWLVEVTLNAFLNARFNLGWYASRIYDLTGTTFVLIVLLSETTTLYAHLARSAMRQRSARQARQVAMDAMAASIAHEINQPLGAIATNGQAALRWLARKTPDIDEARVALKRIVDDSNRAGAVISSIRSMYRKDIHGRTWLGVNDLLREVLAIVEVEMRTGRVSLSLDLREELPQLFGDRGQLQQVFQNLITNAIEAMRSVPAHERLLRVRSNITQDPPQVVVTFEDSGAGIDEKDKLHIFEPFFTTKSAGTGIGLTICRSIIESHGGNLRASANTPTGTIFEVALPADTGE